MLVDNTLFGTFDKIQTAIQLLRQHEPPEGYYVCFSGGKDSVVILDLVKKAGVKFEAHHNIMTIEQPELMQFIFKEYPEVINDRAPTTMYKLIQKYGCPPHRHLRFCCWELKTSHGQGRFKVTGIRAEESPRRAKRQKLEQDLKGGGYFLNLIHDWTTSDVWQYIRQNNLPYCKLYDEGKSRIGCVFCPFAKLQDNLDNVKRYPQFVRYFVTACDRAIKNRLAKGKDSKYKSGQEMFDAWINGGRHKKIIPPFSGLNSNHVLYTLEVLYQMANQKSIKFEIPAEHISQIYSIPPQNLLELAGNEKSFVCPFCGNGAGDDGTGLEPIQASDGAWLYHCLRCDEKFNNLRILANRYHLSTKGKDFIELYRRACSEFGIGNGVINSLDPNKIYTVKKIMAKNSTPKQPATDFKRLAEAQKNLPSFVEKQGGKWRGLTLDTLQQLNCGFLTNVYFPEVKKYLPAVVIPNDAGGVYFRSIEGKFHKNNKPMATTTIFLPDTDNFDIIITEGQINALSILQAFKNFKNPPFGIMACSGTSGEKLILEKLQQLKDSGKRFNVILAFDNDTNNAGKNAADKILDALINAGFTACCTDITQTPDLDLNDILQQDEGEIKIFELVDLAISLAQEELNLTAADIAKFADTSNSDSDMHEVNSSDINGETDAFEIEKNHVLSDAFSDSETQKFFIPLPYFITNHGVKKFGKKDISTICPRPILINGKFFNLEENTFKLSLEHLTANKQWKALPPQPRGNIFNKNKIVELANFGLPVTTGNSAKIVDWIFNFDLANENFVPLTYTVNRCGWFTYKDYDYFIDPRRENTTLEDGKKISIIVDSANQMATSLKSKGTLEKWKEAYNLAVDSIVARATVAAAISAPLLKILNERNFVFYVFSKTRGGKSTSLYLAASAIGLKDMVRIFDGTNNGLIAAAVDTNHYPFFVDEKQSADPKLRADYQRWIYSDANGVERTRANKDGTPRPIRTWQHITVCNGETELLDDTATGGAHTRLLQIAAPNTILDADTCKQIRDIIKDNYGYAFPLFVDYIIKNIADFQEQYNVYQNFLNERHPEILPDYIKYVALICTSDRFFNAAINNKIDPIEYEQLLKLIPTLEDIDDAKKEFNSILGFIAEKAAHFVGSEFYIKDRGLDIYGKSDVSDNFTLLTVSALKLHCKDKSLDYEKSVSDCISRGFFIPDDKVRDSRMTKPSNFVQKKISGIKYNCFQIPNKFIFGDD